MANLITGKDCHNLLDMWLEAMACMEAPMVFGRWCFATGVSAWLERQTWIQFGPMRINPNMYTMIVGGSGSRKSTAIKLVAKTLRNAGYNSIAAEKTSKEKFLLDLQGDPEDDGTKKSAEEIANALLANEHALRDEVSCFVAADEFNEFTGNGNIEFFSLLGALWDFEGVFRQRVKNSQSVEINNPCITILGGNTHSNLNLLFPAEAQGQGFLSRMLFIHGGRSGRKITIPPEMTEQDKMIIQLGLENMKLRCIGPLEFDEDAFAIIDAIYKEFDGLDDMRFASYSERRLTHLLKLVIICTALRVAIEDADNYNYRATKADVIYANTMLTMAEYSMPDALGEYGKSKTWTTQQKVLDFISEHISKVGRPPLPAEIYEHVQTDVSNLKELPELLRTLIVGKKIKETTIKVDNKEQTAYIRTVRKRPTVVADRYDVNLLWELRNQVE